MPTQVLTAAPLHHTLPILTSSRENAACSYAHTAASLDLIKSSSDRGPVAPRAYYSRTSASDMSATYPPSYAVYDSHATRNHPAAAPHPKPRVAVADCPSLQYLRHPPQSVQQSLHLQPLTQPQQAFQHEVPARSQHAQRGSGYLPRPPTPSSSSDATMPSHESPSRQSTDTLIFHSLQIPKCISPAGGNLADFAAQMTCLFWFQSVDDLKKAESIRSIPAAATLPPLASLAKPYEQFRKWVLNVLQTTQVTQNVILLALLFIYRLKMSTPQIKGRAGSEYRLLTVALMLGNKFLDDNTYTNKTWAEVSCFAVQEIHVMEVEFLSNMRYNLLASQEEWELWLTKLACFHEYYDRALRQPASPLHVAVNAGVFQSPISSPKVNVIPMIPDLGPYTPTTAKTFSPTSSHSQDWRTYQANAVSPLASKPARLANSRKRSPEYDVVDHPAKRQMAPDYASGTVPSNSLRSTSAIEARAPVPQLSIVTSQSQSAGLPYMPAASSFTSGSNAALPPLQPGVRAMSTVYQQTASPGLPQQLQHQPQAQQQMMPAATLAPNYPASATVVHPPVNLGTPSKRRSPAHLAQYISSPMVDPYATGSAMHTPLALTPLANSPSIYLQQRSSPYKPVRHVNRLLHPIATSLDQYHLSVPIPPNHIHYQTLGRRNDVRTGVVPEFITYNRQQQQHLPPQSRHQGAYP